MSEPYPLPSGETSWSRLRRRKLGEWSIAYAAAAWGFLQGLEYVGETFGWPTELRRIAILLLLSGLPIVLVIAWYHGERGAQRVGRTEALILAVLVLLGGTLTWHFRDGGETTPLASSEQTPRAESVAAKRVDPRPSIAVLPFENRSAEQADAFFSDGVHDDILTRLSRIRSLRVIARTSVEPLRGTRLGTREIGATLDVRHVLLGAVQRAADRVRISVQLVDTASEAQLWAESFDRELNTTNLFDIQSDVATAIADALSLELASAQPAAPTQNLAAWEAFQQGERAGPAEAEALFQKAIDLDHGFAQAHVALAGTLMRQVFALGARRDVNLPRAEAAAEAALLLDPTLAEAWLVLGHIALDERAESSIRKAIELNPNLAPAHEALSDLLREAGHWEEAYEEAAKALALDPLSVGINESMALASEALQRFDEAERYYRRVIELDPGDAMGYMELANFLAYVRNRFVEAVPLAERAVAIAPEFAYLPGALASIYQDFGDDIAARQVLDQALRRWPDRSNLLAAHAWMSVRQGNQVAAVNAARRLLESNPGHGGAITLLAHTDLMRKDYPAARARFAEAFPELLAATPPTIDRANQGTAIYLAAILLKTGEVERARLLLDRSEALLQTMPRLGNAGYGIRDAMIHALRGDRVKALAALREAVDTGWRGPYWPIILELSPTLAAIRRDPEFRAIAEALANEMTRQRAQLASQREGRPAMAAGEPAHD